MKPLRVLALTTVVFVFLCVAGSAFAQENGGKQEKATSGKQDVTGCLQKGDEAGEYMITAEDGKTYGLRSKAVDLSKHVGHKVTVTGTMRAESAEHEKAEAAENKQNEKMESAEAGDIRVTNLKMISDKCQ